MTMESEMEMEQGTELKLIETRTYTRAFRLTVDQNEKLEKYAAERNVTPTVVIKSALKQTGVI